MTSLPLVSSTYGLVSSAYSTTKDTHPYIRSVCEAAEQGVRTITSVAVITASPIIGKLELQSEDPSVGWGGVDDEWPLWTSFQSVSDVKRETVTLSTKTGSSGQTAGVYSS